MTNPTLKSADGLISSSLQINKQTPFELNFTLEAKNFDDTAVSSTIPLEVIICGDETIILTENVAQDVYLSRNTDIFELFTDVDLLALFTIAVREKCSIETIEFLHTGNSTAILETDELGILLGQADKETNFDPFTFDTTFT